MAALGTDTAVAREAAWLQQANDALPALLVANGGPWDIVQARWPGARFAKMKKGVYLLRRHIATPRSGGVRIRPAHAFWAKCCWPVTGKGGMSLLAETEQANLDAAVELLLERVTGLPFDKSHGGRFLSAGETIVPPAGYPEVTFLDPEVTIPQGWLRADVLYNADDFEVID